MSELGSIVDAFRQLAPGERAALATVVRLEGSAYRRPGARMFIKENGEATGVLSGGCLERDVVERARKVMRTEKPLVVKYDTTNKDDIVWGLGLGCNGIVHVLIEPAGADVMRLLETCAESEECSAIATVFGVEGEIGVTPGTCALAHLDGLFESRFEIDSLSESSIKRYDVAGGYAEVFLEVIQPRTRLVIFGAGFDVLPVVNLTKSVSWHVTVVDTSARVSSLERFASADEVLLCRPEDVMTQVALSERTIAVLMTHNYLHDLELLRNVLPLHLRYLGCLGPKQRTERLLTEISGADKRLVDAYLRRLHAPVGLDIGAETPEEIALSIVSEIKAVLSRRQGTQLRERQGSIHRETLRIAQPPSPPPVALVSSMTSPDLV